MLVILESVDVGLKTLHNIRVLRILIERISSSNLFFKLYHLNRLLLNEIPFHCTIREVIKLVLIRKIIRRRLKRFSFMLVLGRFDFFG